MHKARSLREPTYLFVGVFLPFRSAYVVGSGLIGIVLVVRGGKTVLYDDGVMQVQYVVLLPCKTFGMMQIASLWVSGLPSQLLQAESCAERLKNAAEKRNVFLVLGALNAATVSGSGILTTLFPYWPKVAADMFMALGLITVVSFTRPPACTYAQYQRRGLQPKFLRSVPISRQLMKNGHGVVSALRSPVGKRFWEYSWPKSANDEGQVPGCVSML